MQQFAIKRAAIRQVLRQQYRDQFLLRIDPENRAREPGPGKLTVTGRISELRVVDNDVEVETKPSAVRHAYRFAQTILRHHFHGQRREKTFAVQFTAVQ